MRDPYNRGQAEPRGKRERLGPSVDRDVAYKSPPGNLYDRMTKLSPAERLALGAGQQSDHPASYHTNKSTPPETYLGSPNTAYRPPTDVDFGDYEPPDPRHSALVTGTFYTNAHTEVPARTQSVEEAREVDKDGKITAGIFLPLPKKLAQQFPDKSHEDDSVPHITVLYVGNITLDQQRKLVYAVRKMAAYIRPFEIKLDKYDEFHNADGQLVPHMVPTATHPHGLSALHVALWRAVEDAGIPVGHNYGDYTSGKPDAAAFKSHATLDYLPPEATKYDGPKPTGEWTVSELEVWGHDKSKIPLGGTTESRKAQSLRESLARKRVQELASNPIVEGLMESLDPEDRALAATIMQSYGQPIDEEAWGEIRRRVYGRSEGSDGVRRVFESDFDEAMQFFGVTGKAKRKRKPREIVFSPELDDQMDADADYERWLNGHASREELGAEHSDDEVPEDMTEADLVAWLADDPGLSEDMPGGDDDMALFQKYQAKLTSWEKGFFPDVYKKTKAKGKSMSPKQAKWYSVVYDKLKKFDAKAAAGVPADKPLKKKPKFKPSKYQQAIYDWISETAKKPQGSLVVDAKAGSGKTTTIESALDLIPDNQQVVFLAFNKSIAETLEQKTEDQPNVRASTTSSFGWAAVRREYGKGGKKLQVDDKKVLKILREMLKGKDEQETKELQNLYASDMANVIGKRKMLMTEDEDGNPAFPSWSAVAKKFQVDFAFGGGKPEFDSWKDVEAVLQKAWDANMADTTTFDFADMVLFPAMHKLPFADKTAGLKLFKPDWVMVDESQDLSPTEAALVKRIAPRTVLVGDPNQCAPAGVMVSLPGGGQKPIEELRSGDKVVAFSRESKAVVGRGSDSGYEVEVAVRDYDGPLVKVGVSGLQTRTTPNHRWLVRWCDRERDHSTSVVYLMRKGARYRVGWCQLFTGPDHTVHLTQRARIERADAMWILRAFEERAEASVYESIVAARYGLPTVTFHPVADAAYLTEEAIEAIFDAIGGEEHVRRANQCLQDHGRDDSLPLWPPVGKTFAKMGRTTLFETYAANLEPGLMALPTPTSSSAGEISKEIDYREIERVDREDYSGPIYSLAVDKYGTYVQDGFVTHNSIYAFKGADPDSMEKLTKALGADERPLSICYRCPKKVIAAAQGIVPEIEAAPNAPEGEVTFIDHENLFEHTKPGDYVLCRTTTPLISQCLAAIATGKKANVLGRDIGMSLIKLIDKIGGKGVDKLSIKGFIGKLDAWLKKEIKRLEDQDKEHLIQGLQDKYDSLMAMTGAEGAETAKDVKDKINEVFSNSSPGIMFSTIHKAKGLEAPNIFIMRPDLLPHPSAVKAAEQGDPGAMKQEANLEYVAITRTQKKLTWVNPPAKPDKEQSGTAAWKPFEKEKTPEEKAKEAKTKKQAQIAKLLTIAGEEPDEEAWESVRPRGPSLFDRVTEARDFPNKYGSPVSPSNRTGIGTAPPEDKRTEIEVETEADKLAKVWNILSRRQR